MFPNHEQQRKLEKTLIELLNFFKAFIPPPPPPRSRKQESLNNLKNDWASFFIL